jgi:hypothetical protein
LGKQILYYLVLTHQKPYIGLYYIFSRGWGYCLDDEPADLGDRTFNYPVLPPGTMYDADHQCRLMYGSGAALCDGMKQVFKSACLGLCEMLYITIEKV